MSDGTGNSLLDIEYFSKAKRQSNHSLEVVQADAPPTKVLN